MNAVLFLISSVINIYIWVLIGMVIVGWLMAFNLLNVNSRIIQSLYRVLRGLTDPLLQPIRNFLPNLGGIDISPLVLVLLLVFLEQLLREMFYG